MSEQEKKSGGASSGRVSPVVVVEQSTASRHKSYRPTDLQDEPTPELHHKRSRAPAVPSVTEELKHPADSTDIKERKECEHEISSEKQKHTVAKKLSSSTKWRAPSPETVKLAPLEADKKRTGTITPTSQPIPAPVGSVSSRVSEVKAKSELEKKGDEDSITEEIAELRTFDPTQKTTEWSDDEEASGLPRSDSRASRVSRAVRQLFCCGVPYQNPSEEDVSSPRRLTGI